MKEKIKAYIDGLFAAAPETDAARELKEELTQHTVDHYNDLVNAGKNEEAAYSLAIAGIGDISELLKQLQPEPAPIPEAAAPIAPPYTEPEKPAKPKKGKRWIRRLIIWIPLSLLLTVLLINILLNGGNVSFFSITDGFSYEQAGFAIGSGTTDAAITELDIHWVEGSVTIEPYAGETVQIQEGSGLSEAEQLRWKAENGRLTVYPRRSFWFIGIGDLPSKNLKILLPASNAALSEIQVQGVSASLEIRDLQVNELEIDQVSGNVLLSDVAAAEANISTVSGNLSFDGNLQELSWDTVSGEARVESAAAPTEIESDSVSGAFTLTLPETAGFTVEMDGVSGKLKSDFPLTSAGDAERFGDGSAQYQFDTVSGDVSLKMAK